MARQYNISWNDRQRTEFARFRKNYNAKITRLENKGLPAPERIRMSDIATARDLEKFKKTAETFTARGSEKLVEYKVHKIPEWEKSMITRAAQSVNVRRHHQRKKLGEEKGTERLKKDADFIPINVDRKRTEKEFQAFKSSMKKQLYDTFTSEQMRKFKENYMKAAREYLGDAGHKISDIISGLTPEEVFDFAFSDDTSTIEFMYDEYQNVQMKADRILSNLERYTGEAYTYDHNIIDGNDFDLIY